MKDPADFFPGVRTARCRAAHTLNQRTAVFRGSPHPDYPGEPPGGACFQFSHKTGLCQRRCGSKTRRPTWPSWSNGRANSQAAIGAWLPEPHPESSSWRSIPEVPTARCAFFCGLRLGLATDASDECRRHRVRILSLAGGPSYAQEKPSTGTTSSQGKLGVHAPWMGWASLMRSRP